MEVESSVVGQSMQALKDDRLFCLALLQISTPRLLAVCIHEVISQLLQAFEFCQTSGMFTIEVVIQLIQISFNVRVPL